MTIEAGALAIRITEVGGDQVLSKLGAVDAKAKAVGAATNTVKVSAPNVTGVNAQLQQLGTTLGGVRTAATATTPAIGNLVQPLNTAKAGVNALTASLGQQVLGYYSLGQVVNKALQIYDEFNAAADRQTIAHQKLSATSRLAGVELGTVTAISNTAQSKFALSSGAAADLTQGFVKLASRAGNVAQTGALMSAWMDLAKAQGLSLADIMTGVNSTLVGQDEGLNRLGLLNPSNIWKQWADAAGTTVAKMTEQQKWLSIVNAVMQEGEKVRGEYAKFLETTPGKQEAWNASLERFNAHIGSAGGGVRSFAYDIGTTLFNAFVGADKWLDRMSEKSSSWIRILLGMGPSPISAALAAPPEILQGTPTLSPEQRKAQLDAAAGVKAPPRVPTAAEKAEAKRIAKEQRDTIEKALAIDLGNMPLDTTPLATKPGPTLPGPSVGVDSKGKMKGVPAFGMADVIDKEFDEIAAKLKAKQAMLQSIVGDIAGSVGNAFGDAFSSAFSGDENFFAAFGKSLLKSLGNILMQLGGQMIAYGAIIAPLAALLSFTPFGGLGLGAGASIAAGLAITALGAAMGAAGGGGSKGGGGGGASASPPWNQQKDDPNTFGVLFDPDRTRKRAASAVTPGARSIDSAPLPEARPIVQIGTINSLSPDSQQWQRAVADTYMNARGRGLIRG